MRNLITVMFDSGVFETKHKGIVEIYPRKAMNTFTFDAALSELSKTHEIVKMFPDWLRAFEKKGCKHGENVKSTVKSSKEVQRKKHTSNLNAAE